MLAGPRNLRQSYLMSLQRANEPYAYLSYLVLSWPNTLRFTFHLELKY
jgi:hypothetical protein